MTRIAPALIATAIFLLAGAVHATHKNWVLSDSGTHCVYTQPDATIDQYQSGGGIWGTPPYAFVECPVSLGARWGSSGQGAYGFPGPRWANAMWGNVYVSTSGNSAGCSAVAQMDSGALHFSQYVSSPPNSNGLQTIAVNNSDFWGGDLQDHQGEVVKGLSYDCLLPSDALVTGYKVKICQSPFNPNCHDDLGNDGDVDSSEGKFAIIQESAWACVEAGGGSGQFIRDWQGITNYNQQPFGNDTITCALTPPADDSYVHSRRTTETRVYYSGGGAFTNCVQDYICPVCWMQWDDRRTGSTRYYSDIFQFGSDNTGVFVAQPSTTAGGDDFTSMGYPTHTDIVCQVPNNVTVMGLTAKMSLTRISGGI